MKKALLILCLLGLFALSACTRNHGDIGVWFGTWHVESITADGTRVNVAGDYFFQFQSTVFRVSQVYGHEQLVESFGTWEEQGSTMTIDFPDPDVFYIQMPGLESHNAFAMSDISSKKATFTKVDATGVNYTYQLKKSY